MDFFSLCSNPEKLDFGNESVPENSVGQEIEDSDAILSQILLVTNKYVIPAVGIIGVVLNMCGVATVVHMGVTSSSLVYLIILAIGDAISGFVDSILVAGLPSYGFNIHEMGRWGCKTLKWLNYATTFSTQFILVSFTFDRLLAVTFPLKYQLLKVNLKYPVMVSMLTFPLFYLLTAGNLYVFDLENGECVQGSYISEFGGKVYFHYTASLLYCAIPSALMFTFNIIIIVKMRKRAGESEERKGRERTVTRILLIVSFAFLFFTTLNIIPLYVALFYLAPLMNSEPWAECWFRILLQVNELPAVANVSFNFLFYILGSKIFRDGFKSMIKTHYVALSRK